MYPLRQRLGTGQRVVLVVGIGVVLAAVGSYLTSLGGFGGDFGWFGYAPLAANALVNGQGDLSPWEQLLVWLGLVILWAGVSLWLLQDDYGDDEPDDSGAQDE